MVDSSLYEEDGDVVKVFFAILATKDSDHVCRLDTYKLAKKCNFRLPDGSVDEVKMLEILKLLASPDKRRKMKQEFDGRRIRAVEDGWFVLNGEKYRALVQEEMRKARWRKAQATVRKKKRMRDAATIAMIGLGTLEKKQIATDSYNHVLSEEQKFRDLQADSEQAHQEHGQ